MHSHFLMLVSLALLADMDSVLANMLSNTGYLKCYYHPRVAKLRQLHCARLITHYPDVTARHLRKASAFYIQLSLDSGLLEWSKEKFNLHVNWLLSI